MAFLVLLEQLGPTERAVFLLREVKLIRVLEDWCPPFAGYFLYYPSRRQQAPALSALIEMLRL